MMGRIGTMLWCCALLGTAPAAAAFSAEAFLNAIEQNNAIQELESAEALAENNPTQKKALRNLRKRLAEEKRRANNILREVKPLALKAQNISNINIRDAKGCTLLMHATRFCNEQAISLLLQEDADLSLTDKNGRTALDYDSEEGCGILTAQLIPILDAAINGSDESRILQYCKAGLAADTPLPGGPLVGRLLQAKQFPAALVLLRRGTLKNLPMRDGTLLSELIVSCGDAEILKRGAEMLGKELWSNSTGGYDSLIHILSSGNLPAVQLYVHHLGAGNNLCTLAVRYSTPEVITWILQKENAADKADTWDNYPLFEAARRGNPAVYEAVVAAGGDINRRNTAGETVLMHTALSGSTDMLNAVLQKINADLVSAQDAAGRTAVDYARMSGNTMAEALLRTKVGQENNTQQ